MLKIDIHTHIMPPRLPDFKKSFGYGGFIQLEHSPGCRAKMLRDDGTFFREVEANCFDPLVRLHDCDLAQTQVQVLSTIPVLFSYWAKPQDGLQVARFLNDHIAKVCSDHPKRFVGLGTLPLQDSGLAVKELRRCVTELNLAGVEIGSHINEMNLNDEKLFPFYEAAEDLGAALFVHPWEMMGQDKMPKYWLPWLVGMPAETTLAICSMIFGGVFRRFPRLRVAFAHGGGAFPATIGRIEHGFVVRPDLCAIDNPINPKEYIGKFYVDSLVHDEKFLRYIIDLLGAESIALGSDYPFPLGEERPGTLIESMKDLSVSVQERLLAGTALEWLHLSKDNFI